MEMVSFAGVNNPHDNELDSPNHTMILKKFVQEHVKR